LTKSIYCANIFTITNKQTHPTNEVLQQHQAIDPRVLDLIASLGETLHLSIVDIGGEQCAIARVNDLNPDIKETFDGAGESTDSLLVSDWKSLKTEIELLGGAGDTDVQAVKTGKTASKKEVQVALFGIHNAAELMQAVGELNDIRREDGVKAQEGLPEHLAYLPDNILIATKEMRSRSIEEFERIEAARVAAIGSIAVDSRY
jgi:hypothetical protein